MKHNKKNDSHSPEEQTNTKDSEVQLNCCDCSEWDPLFESDEEMAICSSVSTQIEKPQMDERQIDERQRDESSSS